MGMSKYEKAQAVADAALDKLVNVEAAYINGQTTLAEYQAAKNYSERMNSEALRAMRGE